MKTEDFDKDSWSTPQWLYNWLNWNHRFDVDLCASENNKKHDFFFDECMNSLEMDWAASGKIGFCNPPYSKVAPWVNKAVEEMKKGFTTVMLIPTPNGEKHYQSVLNDASEITFIHGRVAFIAPCDYVVKGKKGKPDKFIKAGDEVSGNTRGSCVVEFSQKFMSDRPSIHCIDRDDTKRFFSQSEVA